MVAVKLNSASVTLFICMYLLTRLYCIIIGIPHLLVSALRCLYLKLWFKPSLAKMEYSYRPECVLHIYQFREEMVKISIVVLAQIFSPLERLCYLW